MSDAIRISAGAPVGRNEVPTWTSLGKRLRELRHGRDWSQARLALEADIHHEQVSRYELGKELPSVSVLAKIAIAFDLEMSELLEGVDAGDLLRGSIR